MNSRAYWQRRALESRIATVQIAERQVGHMARAFARTLAQLREEVESVLASIDGNLARARQRLGSQELEKHRAKYGAVLRQYLTGQNAGRANAILDMLYKQKKVERLEALIENIQLLTYQLYGDSSNSIAATLEATAERGYYGTFHAIETRWERGLEWAAIDEKKLNVLLHTNWSGKHWSDRLWGHVWNFNAQLKDIVTRGVLTGASIGDMATELMGRTNQLRHRAEAIIRTETAYVAGEAAALSYAQAGIDHYTYLATLDGKTSEICRALDQKTFALEDRQVGVNYPPMHTNCRSTTYFSLKPDEHHMRAARDPQTGKTVRAPADWDYATWYENRVQKPMASDKEKSARVEKEGM